MADEEDDADTVETIRLGEVIIIIITMADILFPMVVIRAAIIVAATMFPTGDTFNNLTLAVTVGVVCLDVAGTAIAEDEVHSQKLHNNRVSHNLVKWFHLEVPLVPHVAILLQTQ